MVKVYITGNEQLAQILNLDANTRVEVVRQPREADLVIVCWPAEKQARCSLAQTYISPGKIILLVTKGDATLQTLRAYRKYHGWSKVVQATLDGTTVELKKPLATSLSTEITQLVKPLNWQFIP